MSSSKPSGHDGWYKAGKKSNKRKAGSPLQHEAKTRGASDQCPTRSEQCSPPVPVLSRLLNAANEVLYGDVSYTLDSDTMSDTMSAHAETNRKLDIIMEKLGKLDKIEEQLSRLDGSVKQIEQRVTGMERKSAEFEKSVNFMSGKIDEFQASCSKIKSVSEEVVKHDRTLKMLCNGMDEMNKMRMELKETVEDLQCRSMKHNLVFSGLAGESYDEDTEGKIRDFLNCELGIDDRIEFANVHRFGKFYPGRNRPIVARFIYFNDTVRVKENAYKLRGKPYGINEQFPPAIEERRKKLYPVMRKLKQEGKKPKLVRDKIYVNGARYDNLINIERETGQRSAPQGNRDAVNSPKPSSEAVPNSRIPEPVRQSPTDTPTTQTAHSVK
jgi:hypothetical protein